MVMESNLINHVFVIDLLYEFLMTDNATSYLIFQYISSMNCKARGSPQGTWWIILLILAIWK